MARDDFETRLKVLHLLHCNVVTFYLNFWHSCDLLNWSEPSLKMLSIQPLPHDTSRLLLNIVQYRILSSSHISIIATFNCYDSVVVINNC